MFYIIVGLEEKIKMVELFGVEGGFNYKIGKFFIWIESVIGGNSIVFIFFVIVFEWKVVG